MFRIAHVSEPILLLWSICRNPYSSRLSAIPKLYPIILTESL